MTSFGDECRSCGSVGLDVFHQVDRVPVHCCKLVAERGEALSAPVGELRLGFCGACGFIQNTAHDPRRIGYDESYEDSQAFSPRFQSFASDLAKRLVETYGIRGRAVLEIGCGTGEFLALLCELGDNRGLGVDPAHRPGRLESAAVDRMQFVRDTYSGRHREFEPDLICCRHTLEHLPGVREFVGLVRQTVDDRPDTVVFFEVPDVRRVFDELAFWDLYYEHCSYFSLGSLARLFRSCGFEIRHLGRGFGDQYLLLEASAGGAAGSGAVTAPDDRDELARQVHRFRAELPGVLDRWRERIAACGRRGARTVLWGAGSKAVGFLTTLGIGREIEFVVDINPHKQGMFLAGTGHQIVPAEFLKEYDPDLVIVMNPIYVDEIGKQLTEMKLEPDVVAV
jgi:SAM-dependent methyltransferase